MGRKVGGTQENKKQKTTCSKPNRKVKETS
jgi:hypothetical protein